MMKKVISYSILFVALLYGCYIISIFAALYDQDTGGVYGQTAGGTYGQTYSEGGGGETPFQQILTTTGSSTSISSAKARSGIITVPAGGITVSYGQFEGRTGDGGTDGTFQMAVFNSSNVQVGTCSDVTDIVDGSTSAVNQAAWTTPFFLDAGTYRLTIYPSEGIIYKFDAASSNAWVYDAIVSCATTLTTPASNLPKLSVSNYDTSPAGGPAVYYVAEVATGDGSGSSRNNYMSVASHNAGSFTAGTTIYFDETLPITSEVVPPSSGTSGSPIIYDGYEAGTGPNGCLIDRNSHDSDNTNGINIVSKDWLIIQDFKITDSNNGISVVTLCDNIIVRRNEIYYIATQGIKVGVTSGQSETSKNTYITVGGSSGNGNTLYDVGMDTAGADIVISYTEDWIVSYNKLLGTVDTVDHGTDGIVPVTYAIRGIIEHNLIKSHNDTLTTGVPGSGRTGDGENGIDIKNDSSAASRACHDIIVRFNHIFDHQYEGNVQIQTGTYNTRIYGNVVHDGLWAGVNFYEGANNTNADKDIYNHYIWSNLFYGEDIAGVRSKYSTRTAQMWNFFVWNNTMAENADNIGDYKDANVSFETINQDGSLVKNNLFYKSRPTQTDYGQIWSNSGYGTRVELDNNLYRWPGQTSKVITNGPVYSLPTVYDLNAVIADSTQVMTDPANDDYTLSINSPAIGAGANLDSISIPSITVQGVVYTFDPGVLIDPDNSSWPVDDVPSITLAVQRTNWDIGGILSSSFYVDQTGTGTKLSVAEFNALTGDYSGVTFYFDGNITSSVVPQIYGTSGNPVVLDGYEAGSCDHSSGTLDTNGALISVGSANDGIVLAGNDYVTIQDFRIVDVDEGIYHLAASGKELSNVTIQRVGIDTCDNGIQLTTSGLSYSGGSYITIQNCTIKNVAEGDTSSAKGGIRLYHLTDLVIQDNYLFNPDTWTPGSYSGADAMVILSSSRVLIQRNTVRRWGENCLDFKDDNDVVFGDLIVRWNVFSSTESESAVVIQDLNGSNAYVYGNKIYGNTSTTNEIDDYGILIYRDFENVAIWVNVIQDPSRAGIAFYNDDVRNPKNILIYNNTIVNSNANSTSTDNQHAGIRALNAQSGDLIFKNNIFRDNNTTEGYDRQVYVSSNVASFTTMDYNLYYVDGGAAGIEWNDINYSTLAAWKTASSQGANAIEDNPDFTNWSTRDLTLTAASPAIDSGVTLSNPTWWSVPTIQGVDYSSTVSLNLAIDPNNTDWTTVPPTVTMVDQNSYGAGWERGAYVYK